ncbi:MAG TPA: GNAT family N-acetyltransferase [Vicinamibacteria bacterium]|nr:GNAT family N-acetyltransferase [Vicinamibacteria bacterium]
MAEEYFFIEEIESVRSPLFHASYALYRRVFPKDEQMPKRYFLEHLTEARLGLARPFNFHYLVASRGDKVVGFGCCTYMAVENVGFIDYLAVDLGEEGRGVGTAVRKRLVESLREDARDAGYDDLVAVLGEIQEDSPWLHRLLSTGASALDIEYYQPPLEDHKNPVPLVLYVEPVAEGFAELTVQQVSRILYALYRRLYRIPYPLQDPNFRCMLKQLKGREHVGWKRIENRARVGSERFAPHSIPGTAIAEARFVSSRPPGRPRGALSAARNAVGSGRRALAAHPIAASDAGRREAAHPGSSTAAPDS